MRELLAGLGSGRPAATRGMLFAVRGERGAYPALVPGDCEVSGTVHDAGSVDLAALDAFEGSEYYRAEIELEDGGLAEAYIWAGEVGGLEPIFHGNFAEWLRDNGLSAWS